jgi:membrane-associated phospholipid phosphatase
MLHRLALWAVAAGLPLLVLANWLWGHQLYALGVRLILQMQTHSSPPLDAFFIFFTFIIDPLFVTACIILMLLVMRRKLLAYTTVLFILFNSYLTTVLKAFFAAPRPYWTNSAVRNIGYYCPKDFGNPSGHAEFAAVVGCVILLDLVDKKRQKVWGVVAVLLMGAVSTSRLYLGGHSLDQVMLGLYMGIALSLLYSHGGLKQLIQQQLISSKTSKTSLIFVGLCVMHLLTLAGYWINESKQKSHRQEAKVWMTNFR